MSQEMPGRPVTPATGSPPVFGAPETGYDSGASAPSYDTPGGTYDNPSSGTSDPFDTSTSGSYGTAGGYDTTSTSGGYDPGTSGAYDPASTSAGSSSGGTMEKAKEEATEVGKTAAEAGSQVASTTADKAKEVATEVKDQARDLLGEGRTQLREQAVTGQQKAADGLGAVADELRSMADRGEGGLPTELARQGADKLQAVASWLQQREPGDLVEEVRGWARNHPGTFLIGAALAGVVAGRLTSGTIAARRNNSDSTGNGTVSGTSRTAYPATGYEATGYEGTGYEGTGYQSTGFHGTGSTVSEYGTGTPVGGPPAGTPGAMTPGTLYPDPDGIAVPGTTGQVPR